MGYPRWSERSRNLKPYAIDATAFVPIVKQRRGLKTIFSALKPWKGPLYARLGMAQPLLGGAA
jgi:hypothetical protein